MVVCTLALALVMSMVEAAGGYLGDSSLVPAILVVGGLVCATIVGASLITGQLVLTIKG